MNSYTPGTLVLLKKYSPTLNNTPPEGAIGEIKDVSDNAAHWQIKEGNYAVEFPRHPSQHTTGYWQYHHTQLVPISNPDVDIGEWDDLDNYLKEPVEHLV